MGTYDRMSHPASSVSVISSAASAFGTPAIQEPEIFHDGHGEYRAKSFFPTSLSDFCNSLSNGIAAAREFVDADDPLRAFLCASRWALLASSCASRSPFQKSVFSPAGKLWYNKNFAYDLDGFNPCVDSDGGCPRGESPQSRARTRCTRSGLSPSAGSNQRQKGSTLRMTRTRALVTSPSESDMSGIAITSMGSQPPIMGDGLYIESEAGRGKPIGDRPEHLKCLKGAWCTARKKSTRYDV